jgi:hypothetical protein
MKKKILVVVKTYPNPSKKYQETVCTGGIDEENNWIRLYPIRFRAKQKDQQYKKYDWIEVDLVRNVKDFRPESYHLSDLYGNIDILDSIGTEDKWRERKKYVLHKVYHSQGSLISDAYHEDINTSLATFKPSEIIKPFCKPAKEREWSTKEMTIMEQQDIFENNEKTVLRKIPFKFYYQFKDSDNKQSDMLVLDWEIYQLYWKCYDSLKNEKIAIEKVLEKMRYLSRRDLYLILGTTLEFHRRKAHNPFTIVGLFYPPHDNQLHLFDDL